MSGAVIDEQGQDQKWTAIFWRYFARREEEFDSFEEAWSFLTDGEDYGEMSAEAVVLPDGSTIEFVYRQDPPAEYCTATATPSRA